MEAARLDLMASKEKLEEDIRVKKNSIAIDQVTVMMLSFMRIVTRQLCQTIVHFVQCTC